MDNSSLKDNIYKARIEKGLSQADVAEKINISQTSYHKIEKGKTALISRRVNEIAAVLGLSDQELVFGYHTPEEEEEIKKVEERHDLFQMILDEKDKRISDLTAIIEDKKIIIAFLKERLKKTKK